MKSQYIHVEYSIRFHNFLIFWKFIKQFIVNYLRLRNGIIDKKMQMYIGTLDVLICSNLVTLNYVLRKNRRKRKCIIVFSKLGMLKWTQGY